MSFKQLFRAFVVQIVLLFLFTNFLYGQESVVINNNAEVYRLGLHLELLEDKEKQWTIEDVTKPEISKLFVLNKKERPNFGHTRSAVWARFTILNPSTVDREWVLEVAYGMMDYVNLYIPDQSGSFIQKKIGNLLPFSGREIQNRKLLFRMPLQTRDPQTFYLRVEAETALVLPLILWSRPEFDKREHAERLFLGMYYGVLFVMIIYNFFIYLSLKDLSYLYYVLFVLALGMYQFYFDGFATEYIWKDNPDWGRIGYIFTAGIYFMVAFQFVRYYLSTKTYTPRSDRIFLILAILGASMAILSPALNSLFYLTNIAAAYIALFFVFSSIYVAIVCTRNSYRPAKYFLIALTSYFIGFSLRILRNVGVIPDSFMAVYAFNFGHVIEVTLLSFGLADRINILRQEKELATINTRDEIARNLHDEVGATLTGISYFAKSIVKDGGDLSKDKSNKFLEMILDSTNNAQEKMRDLIWVINPHNDSWDDLFAKFSRYAADLFDAKEIEYKIDFPSSVTFDPLDMACRQNFWLIFKEMVTNIVKHSNCEKATLRISVRDELMSLTAEDDGVGFNPDAEDDGIGLKSIQIRATNLNARLNLQTQSGKGTRWDLEFKC